MTTVTASRFSNLTGSSYRLLMAIPQEIADVVNAMRQQRLKIALNTRITQAAMQADIGDARQQCIVEVESLVQKGEGWKADIDRAVAEVFGSIGDVNAQLLEQISQQRMWDRQRRLLDAGANPKDLIRQAGAAGDALALRTLREELPAFYGMPQGVGTVRSGADGYSEVPELIEALDAAELPLLDPVERQARALQSDVTRGWANGVLAAQNYALYELQGKGDAPYIPGWQNDTLIELEGSKTGSIRATGRL